MVGLAVLTVGWLYRRNLTSVQPAAEFAQIQDPLLQRHFAAQSAVTAYRVESFSSGRGTTTTTEVQLKDGKLFLRSADFVIVDATAYYYRNGQWQQQALTATAAATYQAFNPQTIKRNYLTSQTSSKFGKLPDERCDSLMCFKYEQVDAQDPEAKRIFWFDQNDFLLRQDTFTFGEFIASAGSTKERCQGVQAALP